MKDSRLRALAALALLYATVRFVEAYGLWHVRAWAEWFAIISGSVYIPIEIYERFRRPTWMRGLVLATNLVNVAYLLNVRRLNRLHTHPRHTEACPVRSGLKVPRR
jgi:uncharacterized membrane protein (DUF2068 family)